MKITRFFLELAAPFTPGMKDTELAQLKQEIEEKYLLTKTSKKWLIDKGAKPTEFDSEGVYSGELIVPWRNKLQDVLEHPYFRLLLMYIHFFAARIMKHWHMTAGQVEEDMSDDPEVLREQIKKFKEEKSKW